MDEVTIWAHDNAFAAPWPEEVARLDTFKYPGTPYWIPIDSLGGYVRMCLQHGHSVVIHTGE